MFIVLLPQSFLAVVCLRSKSAWAQFLHNLSLIGSKSCKPSRRLSIYNLICQIMRPLILAYLHLGQIGDIPDVDTITHTRKAVHRLRRNRRQGL